MLNQTFILKDIFENYFDDFICPVIFSPYFEENNIPNEILLFNLINTIEEIDTIPINTETINISKIFKKNNINLFTVSFFMNENETAFFQYEGKKNNIDNIFEKNKLINKKRRFKRHKRTRLWV